MSSKKRPIVASTHREIEVNPRMRMVESGPKGVGNGWPLAPVRVGAGRSTTKLARQAAGLTLEELHEVRRLAEPDSIRDRGDRERSARLFSEQPIGRA